PACGCECRIKATGARGRVPGWKRPSRRPSGPGKITSGMKVVGARQLGGATRVRSGVGSYIGAGVHVAIGRKVPILSASERLYLDHAATTPVLPQARAALQRGLDSWANPNSPHAEGRAARALLEEARSTIAQMLGWRHDVIFTSGASEAVEIAGRRAIHRRRAHSATEHAIVP